MKTIYYKIALFCLGVLLFNGCSPDDEQKLESQSGEWKLVWSDEFDGELGAKPDPSKWTFDIGRGTDGWGNQELQHYTDRTDNVSLDGNGNLLITAIKESFSGASFTSGRIKTKGLFEFKQGRIEARIKTPYGPGIWPAFWMLGANVDETPWPQCGEIDIMELKGNAPNIIHGTLHGPGYSAGNGISKMYALENDRFDTDFHVFAVEWYEDRIDFFVDDYLYHRVSSKDVAGEWVYNNEFFIILNLAIGGNFVGFPTETTDFPQTLTVDYVRVYQGKGGTNTVGNGGGNTDVGPTIAAPTPTHAAADVLSIVSNAYTNVPVTTYRTDWSSATLEDVSVAGKPVKKYSNLDFVGIETTTPTVDASKMTHVHIDVWSPDFTKFGIKLVDFGANEVYDGGGDDVEHQLNFDAPAKSGWVSYNIPLSDFTGLTTREHLAQYVLIAEPSGSSTVYVDNFYFYNDGTGGNSGEQPGGLVPTVAAPAPTHAAADVLSILSNAYTNVPVTIYRTDWSSATLEDVTIAGKAVKKYSSLDFVGIETTTPTLDASKMTHVHMDVWSPDFTKFSIKLVDFGANGVYDGGGDDVEHQLDFDAPAKSGWVSYNIPLSDFKGLTTRGHLAQYILVAQPGGTSTVYVDNFYFYNDGTGGNGGGNNGGENNGGNEPTDHPAPTTPAPTPPARNAADVRSVFSSAYTNVPVDTYLIDWSASKQSMVKVGGKDVLKYYDLDYAAIATEGSKVVSINGMTHVHVDVWSPNFTNLSIKLSDFGSSGLGEVSYGVKNYPTPAQSQWISYDIPISEFEGLNPSGHIGLSFFSGTPVGSMILYVDNFYFYKK